MAIRVDGPSVLTRPLGADRTSAHLLSALVLWPLLTVAAATLSLMALPYYGAPPLQALAAAALGAALLGPDLALAAVPAFGVSWLIFRRWGRDGTGRAPRLRLLLEPAIVLLAILAGTSLFYPALVSGPLLAPVRSWPAAAVVLAEAAAVLAGLIWTLRPGARMKGTACVAALGLLAALPVQVRAAMHPGGGGHPAIVVLGIDSLSQGDDLSAYERLVRERGGTWYERAVSPGLLTNAVWNSVLTTSAVGEHGVFHTFQHEAQRPFALLEAARATGLRTVSYFPDQLTCPIGTAAPFDADLSGPVGWRQVLLPVVANSSLLVPLVRPLLPGWWPSALAPNQAATYTYDVRRDVRAILSAGGSAPAVVAAHLTYLHLPAYPRTLDLEAGELRRLARAPAGAVRDRSFDWQDVEQPGDPVPLRSWKLARLAAIVGEELARTRYLEGGGRLIVFSDHGDRGGLTLDTFTDPKYHHVLLATFGVPARCPDRPISLRDVGALLGLTPGGAEPVVEFALAPPGMWPDLVATARLRWPGFVDLSPDLLAGVRRDLRRHRPWSDDVKSGGGGADTTCSPASVVIR